MYFRSVEVCAPGSARYCAGVSSSRVRSSPVVASDPNQFPASSAFGYYVYNGPTRISTLQPVVWSGSKVVVTVDGQVVYSG